MIQKTGRPPKGGSQGAAKLTTFRLTRSTLKAIEACAKSLEIPKTRVVELGVDLVCRSLKREKEQP